MRKRSNLIIAAHPDDEILGCGGIIRKKAKAGVDSYVLILTDGSSKRYSHSQKVTLKNNALSANETIGTKKVFFENLPNQGLDTIPLLQIIRVIEHHIDNLNIDTIFTHHGGDLNKDHRIVYEATITAARPLPEQKIKHIYTYNVASSTEWNSFGPKDIFIPNYFMDIENEIEDKIDAMKCYKSECRKYPHPRSPESLRCHAGYWGLMAGMKCAEPFHLIRAIEKE